MRCPPFFFPPFPPLLTGFAAPFFPQKGGELQSLFFFFLIGISPFPLPSSLSLFGVLPPFPFSLFFRKKEGGIRKVGWRRQFASFPPPFSSRNGLHQFSLRENRPRGQLRTVAVPFPYNVSRTTVFFLKGENWNPAGGSVTRKSPRPPPFFSPSSLTPGSFFFSPFFPR